MRRDNGEGALLRVEDLIVAFGDGTGQVDAVKGLSFDISVGETLAIVGESGSGKTVSALAALGLIGARGGRVLSGRAVYLSASGDTLDFLATPARRVRRVRGLEIGMVFQEPMTSLNPVLKVGDQLTEAARLHRGLSRPEARALGIEMLTKVRLPEAERRLGQYPHELSGGMRQRVMIAMALACGPRLLVADEPTTALDVTVQAEILSLIKHLQREMGLAVLFITHDLGVVAEMSDRVVVMQDGVQVEGGQTANVLLAPKHPYTRMLLSAVPVLGAAFNHPGPMRISVAATDAAEVPAKATAASRPAPPMETGDGGPVLRVEHLSKRFVMRRGLMRRPVGTVHAVEDVNFEIGKGETLGLVGESGCGKTTTGRCILRLLPASSGGVWLNNTDVMQLDGHQLRDLRREMQIVFQDPYASLNPRKTAGQLVGEPMAIHLRASGSELRDRVDELFVKVGLSAEHFARYPHEFSGGQRQRICIARALCLNPKLIVADEPVSALDVSIRAQIVNLMIDLQEEFGLSYLFISHDMAVVERMSHRIAVMRIGRIVEIGPRDAVLSDPRHPYTRKLIDAVPNLDPKRRKLVAALSAEELTSPLIPPGRKPPPLRYEKVGPGHLVADVG